MSTAAASIPLIPDTAPFSAEQRSWLNGFLAGLYGGTGAGASLAAPPAETEEFPWHDPTLPVDERLSLAHGKPPARRLMAAMAQLDCGQCGYVCQTYAEALAEKRETSLSLCVPGARETTKTLRAIIAEISLAAPAVVTTPAAPSPAAPSPSDPAGRPVRVLSAETLTRPGSAKDVRHIVIDLAQSGLAYQPGDSLSIAAANDPALVDACLDALGADPATPIPCRDGEMRAAREALTHHLDIARPLDRTLDLLAMSAKHLRQAATLRRLADGDDAEPQGADLLDLLDLFPSARPGLGDLARSLPALKPRLYSIASSQRARPGEVHLCVSVVADERRGRVRQGVASGFLARRGIIAGTIAASIKGSHFRLPDDPATPIIMCGPGTGIAPFRAFLQERAARGLKGRTWLFFGEQRRATDFLFEDELDAWRADGTLGRIETAFSRDQAGKIYVQDRMAAEAPDLWRWLQQGAHFYVCGDATRMAKDVDAALRRVAIAEGGLSEAQAKDWIIALARQGRYKRDVY